MFVRKRSAWLIILAMLFFVASCGMNEEVLERAKGLEKEITSTQAVLKKRENEYASFKNSSEFKKEFRVYAERENWQSHFDEAGSDLQHAINVQKKQIVPLVEKNDSEDEGKLLKQMQRVKGSLKLVQSKSRIPTQRIGEIRTAKKNSSTLIKQARAANARLNKSYIFLREVKRDVELNHPRQKLRVKSQFAEFERLRKESNQAFAKAESELRQKTPDYALFDNAVKLVVSHNQEMEESKVSFRQKQKTLDTDYAKILDDMRVIYKVQIGRTSWDDGSDWDTNKDVLYQHVEVDEETYEYFAVNEAKYPFAKHYRSWGNWSSKIYVDQGKWSKLGIPWRAGWPSSSHDAAEYWLNDLPVVYQHRYVYVRGDKKATEDWEVVDEAYFEANVENLGMTLVSKPLSYYEEEVIKTATPPGMDKVGNEKYGQWKKDPNTGQSFWAFYGQYMFLSHMLGGHRYYYDDWSSYDRSRRSGQAYYGKNKSWGSSGKYAQTKMSDRTAFRQGTVDRRAGGIRGAGKSGRGRGPGKMK